MAYLVSTLKNSSALSEAQIPVETRRLVAQIEGERACRGVSHRYSEWANQHEAIGVGSSGSRQSQTGYGKRGRMLRRRPLRKEEGG